MMKYVLFDIVKESALVFVLQIYSMKPPDQLQMFIVSSQQTFQYSLVVIVCANTEGGTWGVVRNEGDRSCTHFLLVGMIALTDFISYQ